MVTYRQWNWERVFWADGWILAKTLRGEGMSTGGETENLFIIGRKHWWKHCTACLRTVTLITQKLRFCWKLKADFLQCEKEFTDISSSLHVWTWLFCRFVEMTQVLFQIWTKCLYHSIRAHEAAFASPYSPPPFLVFCTLEKQTTATTISYFLLSIVIIHLVKKPIWYIYAKI